MPCLHSLGTLCCSLLIANTCASAWGFSLGCLKVRLRLLGSQCPWGQPSTHDGSSLLISIPDFASLSGVTLRHFLNYLLEVPCSVETKMLPVVTHSSISLRLTYFRHLPHSHSILLMLSGIPFQISHLPSNPCLRVSSWEVQP